MVSARQACPGRWRRLRGPRWWRNDPVGRVRRGDRRLLGRGHRHCRRSASLERSPRRAIRVDRSVADRDLVGPAPSLRGKHRHHHRPPRTPPHRCDRDDPHPGEEPPHPDRLTIPVRTPFCGLDQEPAASKSAGSGRAAAPEFEVTELVDRAGWSRTTFPHGNSTS